MKSALQAFETELEAIRAAGTWREERIITTPQRSRIDTTEKRGVVNLCANNYLGLSNDPHLIQAAKESYDRWGFGLSSVRFICGTQQLHKELERRIAALRPLLRECRQLQRLTAHYYDRSYCRDQRYRI